MRALIRKALARIRKPVPMVELPPPAPEPKPHPQDRTVFRPWEEHEVAAVWDNPPMSKELREAIFEAVTEAFPGDRR